MDGKKKFILDFAFDQFGEPYVWGGDGNDKWDCSGLVLGCLKYAGLWGTNDTTAQGIQRAFHIFGESVVEADEVEPGDLVFYGHNEDSIVHVGICLGNGIMIGANGSKLRGGKVDIRPIKYHPLPVVAYIDPVIGWEKKQKV